MRKIEAAGHACRTVDTTRIAIRNTSVPVAILQLILLAFALHRANDTLTANDRKVDCIEVRRMKSLEILRLQRDNVQKPLVRRTNEQ